MSAPQIKPRSTTVILFQGDDFDRIEAARVVVEAAVVSTAPTRLNDADPVRAAAQAYDVLVAEAAGRGVHVEVRAVPRRKWRELVLAHPPREDDETDKAFGFNYLTLGDDLVPASVPAEFDTAWLDDLSDAHFSQLYSAAVQMNQGQSPDPKASMSSRLGRTLDETSTPPPTPA